MARTAFVLGCGLAALPGCGEETLTCTGASCEDRAAVEITGPADAWVAGPYTLDVRLTGEHHCTFAMPARVLVPGTSVPLECAPSLGTVGLSPVYQSQAVTACLPRSDAGAPSCPAQSYRIAIVRTDASANRVEIRLARGGDVLLDEARPFDYEVLQPNGPECGPTCRLATVPFTLPER